MPSRLITSNLQKQIDPAAEAGPEPFTSPKALGGDPRFQALIAKVFAPKDGKPLP
jgi:hypothetical protein